MKKLLLMTLLLSGVVNALSVDELESYGYQTGMIIAYHTSCENMTIGGERDFQSLIDSTTEIHGSRLLENESFYYGFKTAKESSDKVTCEILRQFLEGMDLYHWFE